MTNEYMVAPTESAGKHDHHGSIGSLLGTFAMLIALTVVTVCGSKLSLGSFEIWFAMGIASIKAVLVAVFFMHLRHDKTFNILIVLFSLIFAAIFIGLTMIDSNSYQNEISDYVESQSN